MNPLERSVRLIFPTPVRVKRKEPYEKYDKPFACLSENIIEEALDNHTKHCTEGN